VERRNSTAAETVTGEIIASVASTKGVDTVDLNPLYDAIDPDAVGALVERGFTGKLVFRYEGCTVAVHGDGRVHAESDRRDSDPLRVASDQDVER